MGGFQIHEDIENYPRYRNKKITKVVERKNRKKNFLQNKDKIAGFQFGRNINKNIIATDINQEKPEQSPELPAAIDVSLLQIAQKTPENQCISFGKEYFPATLMYNDEYRKEIWQHLIELEQTFPAPKPEYMLKQVELCWRHRAVLVDWLVNVTEEYKLGDETFHLTVNYIDRFLSNISVARTKLQLVGAAALRLASKMEEYFAIEAKELAYLTDNTYTIRDILKMENIMLTTLDFNMQPPTVNRCIQHLCSEYIMEEKIVHFALYISELVLLEGKDYITIPPSKLAAASIALARYGIRKMDFWPKTLKDMTGYSLRDLSWVLSILLRTLRNASTKEQKAIREKYGKTKKSRVSELVKID